MPEFYRPGCTVREGQRDEILLPVLWISIWRGGRKVSRAGGTGKGVVLALVPGTVPVPETMADGPFPALGGVPTYSRRTCKQCNSTCEKFMS